MSVQLEKFSESPSLAWKRGGQLHKLIDEQHDWVQAVLPKVVVRYRDPIRARLNYARLARAEEVTALLVLNEADEPIGTASAMPNQRLKREGDSDEHRVWGTDTDYWLRQNATAAEHEELGEKLIQFIGRHAASRIHQHQSGIDARGSIYSGDGYSPEHYVMTSVFPEAENQPLGLIALLEPVGEPSRLVTPAPKELELAKGGEILQLYQGQFPVDL